MPTLLDFEKGQECVRNVMADKEPAAEWFKARSEEKVGMPGHGSDCPLFHFLSAACPEVTIVSFGGDMVKLMPVEGTVDDKGVALTLETEEIHAPNWAFDFTVRLDGKWLEYVGEGGEITGEIAAGILARSGTRQDERAAMIDWLRENDREFLDAHPDMFVMTGRV